ncbi:MAG: T9SS type A sorting domain-containing protein [Flavobacterium sp.]|nr:T9SS type A sorting domain-containing protein [Flavobacterium sp.]
MKSKLLYFAIFLFQISLSQQRTCGKDAKMQELMNNPVALQNYINLQNKFEVELSKVQNQQNRAAAPYQTIIIPVAVHFPSVATNSTIKACLRTLAQSQINILNADYNAANADISQWTTTVSAFYPGTTIGNLNVQFVIATQNHPAGTGLVNGDLAVTFGTDYLNGADNDTTWNGYVNLVCRDANGNLGYSQLGGVPNIADTVVINFDAFGSGSGCTGYIPSSPYNLGRTLTHELGHYFNLDHPFIGCTTATNCATAGDKVCDTPPSNLATYGCPAAGATTKCNVKTLTMNYMDYTDDACMYMFTKGQENRMRAYYNTISSQLKTNVLSNNEFLARNFSIEPNPNNGTFKINLKEQLNDYSIEIFDVTGRNVFENNFKNQDLQQIISLKNTTTGIYFINFKSDNSILTRKIIIE